MSSGIHTRPTLELHEFHGMVSVSSQMQVFFELVERVAKTPSSILIRGETGTGKELVARAIHSLSQRSSGPFRAVNCATFTPELLASELFGHIRGAFTGAIRDRQGLFSAAHHGTVFLDEIAELPLDLQARLLRVVESKSFVPVGATDAIQVDIRLISATHRALRREVEEGRFREDLMYRLRVVPIFLPRLVERDGDIEALLWRFIDELNERGNRIIDGIEEAAYRRLMEYPWPGNIRELKNVVEYVFAVGITSIIREQDLTPELRGEGPTTSIHDPRANSEIERIHDALQKAGGRKNAAAKLLGISRSTLWRKLREYRIDG